MKNHLEKLRKNQIGFVFLCSTEAYPGHSVTVEEKMTSMEQDTFRGGKRSHEDPHGACSDPVGLVETASKRIKRGESISLNKLSSGNRASHPCLSMCSSQIRSFDIYYRRRSPCFLDSFLHGCHFKLMYLGFTVDKEKRDCPYTSTL
jgi:hypothetical protein